MQRKRELPSTVRSHNTRTIKEKQTKNNVEHEANVHFTSERYRRRFASLK